MFVTFKIKLRRLVKIFLVKMVVLKPWSLCFFLKLWSLQCLVAGLCRPRLGKQVSSRDLLASPTVWLCQEGMLDWSMLVYTPFFFKGYQLWSWFSKGCGNSLSLRAPDHDVSDVSLGSGLSYKMTGSAGECFCLYTISSLGPLTTSIAASL